MIRVSQYPMPKFTTERWKQNSMVLPQSRYRDQE